MKSVCSEEGSKESRGLPLHCVTSTPQWNIFGRIFTLPSLAGVNQGKHRGDKMSIDTQSGVYRYQLAKTAEIFSKMYSR